MWKWTLLLADLGPAGLMHNASTLSDHGVCRTVLLS